VGRDRMGREDFGCSDYYGLISCSYMSVFNYVYQWVPDFVKEEIMGLLCVWRYILAD
jgi:hypothetical protein